MRNLPHGSATAVLGRLLAAATLLSLPVFAQVPVVGSGPGGIIRIHNTDLAVLEAGEERDDLPCTVLSTKPFLGFDLRFHSGYEVTVPLKELAGSENLLTILFRVTYQPRPDEPHYFVHRIRVPSIEPDAKGDAFLQGGFDVGEGAYKVDWLMRDRSERVCSSSWEMEAVLPPKDKSIAVVLPPGDVEPVESEQFREEPPVERTASDPPLNVKVLMNLAPQRSESPAMRPLDTAALVSLLRTISREPRISKFSLVVFNLQERRVIYRQDNADRIDFPALGESLNTLNLGRVNLSNLAQKHGDTEFLGNLLRKELVAGASHDALIFAGPKAMLEENVSREQLEQLGSLEYPVFYMNYNLNPQLSPWRDSIGQAVRFLKGYEYTISRPRELWFAVTEMVSRIVKYKSARQVSSGSAK